MGKYPVDINVGIKIWRPILSILMIVLLLAAIAPVRADNSSNARDIANSSVSTYIVVFNDTPQPAVQAQSASDLITSYGGHIKYRYGVINGMAITMPDSQADRLKSLPDVKYVEKDQRIHVLLDQAVPQIGANQVWDEGYSGKGVRVAVIDTGIDASHPDLNGGKVVAWIDYVNNGATPYDDNGHGTHISSIIAGTGSASGGRYRGVAPNASLIVAKALDSGGAGYISNVINGINWAILNHAQVISLSMGTNTNSPSLESAVSSAVASGVVVVVASGNDGPGVGTIDYPGDNPDVITVGAVDKSDKIADFSSRGPTSGGSIKPDVVNVGVSVVAARSSQGSLGSDYTTNPYYPYYMSLDGTSMSTPMTAGVVALMLEKDPSLAPAQVKSLLTSTAKPLGGSIPNNDYGWGRVQAKYAVDNITVYNSSYVSDTIPGTMLPNQTSSVVITMRNTGTLNWSRANNTSLQGLFNASLFGATSLCLPDGTIVPPGGQYTWTFNMTAPALGNYTLSYQVYNNTNSFGYRLNKSIRVKTAIQPGTLQFNNSTYSALKSDGITSIRVDRVGGMDNTVSANYSIGGGNATPGIDYLPVNGTLTFAQDQSYTMLNVTLLNDGIYKGDRDVNLTLGEPAGGATLGASNAVLDIKDNIVYFTYHLHYGWNLISIPLVPYNTNISNFFPADVKANLTIAWAYDNSNPQSPAWRYYKPTRASNTLSVVAEKTGYWLLMKNNMSMCISGMQLANDTVVIRSGWNLVGSPDMVNTSPSSLFGSYYLTWGYENNQWYYYKPTRTNNTLSNITPGYGYWVLKK